MSSVSAHVAHTLARSVEHVFGVMGNGNAYFVDALVREGAARYTAVRHEAGAVVAADAYHRAGGGLAAATATYGAGFTNTLTALAEAVQARVPLVVVVGDEPTSGPRGFDVDQIALAAAVGARTYTVGRTDAAATTVIAVEHALAYRLPVVLAIPYDVARAEAGPLPRARSGADAGTSTSTSTGVDTELATLGHESPWPEPRHPDPVAPGDAFTAGMIRELAGALAGAERPLIVAGRGAFLADAGEALGALAAATGALTATTALGRSLFPEARYDLGVIGGFASDRTAELVREAEVAVVFGASLNPFTMRFGELFSPGTRVFQIDTAATATHPHVGGFIRGDAALVARAVLAELGHLASSAPPRPWREHADLARVAERHPGERRAADGRLDPRAAACRLAELLPADRVVVSDGGHFMGWPNMYWPVAAPDRMLMVGTAYQSIGLGFASVPGAALAKPEATVVLVTGDGGGLMALADLETAVRVAGGRGLAVVWNDAAYGAEVNLYGLKGLADEPMRIPDTDFAALAGALGAHGVVVRDLDDLDLLADWTARPATERPFLLLDLRISPDVLSPHQHEIIRANA